MKKIIDITTIKFVLVGIINTIVGTGTMFLLYNVFHTGYWTASVSNYIVGSIVSYLLNKYFTFKSKDRSGKSIFKFIINISVCYLIAYGIAKPCAAVILSSFSQVVKENVAMLIGMCLFVVLNYFGQRFWVFKEEK